MKSNYKALVTFIEPVSQLNEGMEVKELLGISNQKYFQNSHTNTIDIDLQAYRIVRTNQFAYNRATTRNGDKISIALRQGKDCIVSPSYRIFKSKDENVLNSEYLMMWFRRPEFDRYARFKSHGSAHEFFEFDQMCQVELPVPHIDKQREIVKEYNLIQNRITLNQQLIQKLEETLQAIYTHWFVDFQFPDENGKSYKCNGGEMVWNEELQKEIPKGWEVELLGNLIESFSKTHSFIKDRLIFFNTSDILNGEFLHSNYMDIFEMPGQAKKQIRKDDILFSEIRPNNKRYSIVRIEAKDYIVSTKLMVLRKKLEIFTTYRLYQFLTEESFITELQQSAEGRSGTFPQITFEEDLQQKPFLIANKRIEQFWDRILNSSYDLIFSKKDENKKLNKMKQLLLSKLATVEN